MERHKRPRYRAADINRVVALARIVADQVPNFADRFVRRPIDHYPHRSLMIVVNHEHHGMRENSDREDTATPPRNAQQRLSVIARIAEVETLYVTRRARHFYRIPCHNAAIAAMLRIAGLQKKAKRRPAHLPFPALRGMMPVILCHWLGKAGGTDAARATIAIDQFQTERAARNKGIR